MRRNGAGNVSPVTLLALGLLAAAPHAVAVDLSGLDRQSYQELDAVSLERAIVVRLVQEGFAVVAASAAPHIRVAVTRRGRTVTLAAAGASAQVELEPRRLREFHLEAAQKAVEVARAAEARLPPVDAPPPAATPEPPPPALSPPAEALAPRRWQVLAAGGAAFRAPGVDARLALAARLAAAERVGVHLELGLSPVPGTPLSAYDGSLLLGAGLLLTPGLFRLEAGLSIGATLHVFTLARDGAVEPDGSRVDFLARPFLRGTFNPVSGLLIWLQLGGGLSSRSREHRLVGVPVYSRGALWVDAVLGLGWET